MLNSGSACGDAIISVLKAKSASVFNDQNLSKNDFGLLDTTTSSCVYMLLPPSFDKSMFGFEGSQSREAKYHVTIRGFVRDVPNPVTTLNLVWQMESDISNAIDADSDLSGSAFLATLIHGTGWDGNTVYTTAGGEWIHQDFTIQVHVGY